MKQTEFDIIIIGSGPAGVSAAYPLVEAGLKVCMVDGGRIPTINPPMQPFLDERSTNKEQWKWIIGEDFHALKKYGVVSPKLRVPIHGYVFDDFLAENPINAKNFVTVGSLAQGGLSNAWGCGVAKFSASELANFPFPTSSIEQSYATITQRMGVSGADEDDLSDYFGLDEWSQMPIPMDALHTRLFERYKLRKSQLSTFNFRLGRSRVAVISQEHRGRKACNICGNCLWGCSRQALYSSANELSSLLKYENFNLQSGFIAEQIIKIESGFCIQGHRNNEYQTVTAKKVLLAAGTLASTRLALRALKVDLSVRLQSSPTAAFLLWLPKMLGTPRINSFGLGQLSFVMQMSDTISTFGSTFSATGIPITEFVRHLPFRKRCGIDLLRHLLSSCLVGNIFLPGFLSKTHARLNDTGELVLDGNYDEQVPTLMANCARQLSKAYRQLNAWILPKSFTVGTPGTDLHYACTFPMRSNPTLGETNWLGELPELPGLHIIDGACLPILSEKPHTLTIMANADRISRELISANFVQAKYNS